MLINLAKAIGRIVMAYKDVQQLAGITSRVHAFLQVLDDLRAGVYCSRNPVTGEQKWKDDEERGILRRREEDQTRRRGSGALCRMRGDFS